MDRDPKLENLDEIKIVDGKKYKKVYTGYTVRQYFSHNTIEKGPGPGWDTLNADREAIAKKFGIDKTWIEPEDLPDEPYYTWKQVEEQ
jgi:hypothetical protein